MRDIFKKIDKTGSFAGWVITIATSGSVWAVVVSTAVAVWVATTTWLVEFFGNPHAQIGIGVFLVILWSYIGLRILWRWKPDYRWGLTFEGLVPFWQPFLDDAALSFGIQFRNFTQAPVSYKIEKFIVQIETRTLPKNYIATNIQTITRGGGRLTTTNAFALDHLREFYGRAATGTVEFSVIYGAPKKRPVRRLNMIHSVTLKFSPDGQILQFSSNIEQESDDPA